MDVTVLPGFVLAVLLIALAPGPDIAYITAVAIRHGPRAGVVSAVGMALGMSVHITATVIGATALLELYPWTMTVLQVAGGCYLVGLGVQSLRAMKHETQIGVAPRSGVVLKRALITNLTNPKVILFFASFLPRFADAERGSMALQLFSLGAIFLLIGLACDTTIGLLAGQLGTTLMTNGRATMLLTLGASLTYLTLGGLLLRSGAEAI